MELLELGHPYALPPISVRCANCNSKYRVEEADIRPTKPGDWNPTRYYVHCPMDGCRASAEIEWELIPAAVRARIDARFKPQWDAQDADDRRLTLKLGAVIILVFLGFVSCVVFG